MALCYVVGGELNLGMNLWMKDGHLPRKQAWVDIHEAIGDTMAYLQGLFSKTTDADKAKSVEL